MWLGLVCHRVYIDLKVGKRRTGGEWAQLDGSMHVVYPSFSLFLLLGWLVGAGDPVVH
jgi:hypothetical protein